MLVRRRSVAVAVVACLLAAGCTDSARPGTIDSPDSSTSAVAVTALPTTEVALIETATDETATDETVPTDPDGSSADTIDWGACTDESAIDERLQCSTLAVPLDYDDPAGETIDLALVRLPASDDDRDGAVLFNPGGPGGSGFEFVTSGGPTIASELGLGRLDLIGFDPRGVDRSGGLRCLSNAQLDAYAYPDNTPDDPEEEAFLDEADSAFATACVAEYGDTLRFYSTANTARDMDQIRIALGDEQISFLGISYGTFLGAVYATLFPQRVRAMVLDSAFEPGGDTIEQQYLTQLSGFEDAFDEWADWCETDDACGFRADDVVAGWDALRERLDESPITNSDGRVGNQALLERATKAALYSTVDWPVLGEALADAEDGDVSGLFRLADSYFSRGPDGVYATIKQSNTIINCASGIEADEPADPEALATVLRAAAPRFGRDIVADDLADRDGCADLMPEQPLDTIGYDGDAPIVVVGGRHDPATPLRWATEMTAAMGPSARLVTYTGDGHGQLLASSCVTALEAAALTDLRLPQGDAVCDADPQVAQPVWWDSVPVPRGVGQKLDSPTLAAALGLAPTDLYSEIRTSSNEMTEVLAAYRPLLEASEFRYLGEQERLPGATQAVYEYANGELFVILLLGDTAFEGPQLESAAALVPDGKVLVVLLYLPPS